MVTIGQVKAGLTEYLDSEILAKMSGAKRFGTAVYLELAM